MDNCGIENTVVANVPGYAVYSNNFTLTPHCGSFDINLAHSSNGAGGETFWLQKFDPATSSWGHPGTGIAYVDGTAPTSLNSYSVANNFTTLNLTFNGTFRILKRFESFENGSVGATKNCIEVIREFEFTGIFAITGFEKVTCNGELSDIRVLTNGVPPLTYKIIAKNGLPFLVDNGNNSIFTNLEAAIYTFRVQHSCGHIAERPIDVNLLPSLVNANQPGDLATCDDTSNDGVEAFNLLDQNASILGTQNPADYQITYHLSAADAATGNNPLPYTYTSGNQEIFARLKYIASANCFDIVSFQLAVYPLPVPDMKNIWHICDGNTLTITAEPGFDYYHWSDGSSVFSGQTYTVTQPGAYTLTVSDGQCEGTLSITVELSNPAVIRDIEISDWTDTDNTITVLLDGAGVGNYLYSLDNIHFQGSNTFTDLPPGFYTVYVKDDNGCGMTDENVVLLNYPKYFTPNGDGYHDFWKIRFSEAEPHLKTYVFDRYGKVITGFLPNSAGWDGTLNGEPLPSTDYWFVVIRENGKTFRGHFAMKR
jgi:gliding motility-associated-like protein